MALIRTSFHVQHLIRKIKIKWHDNLENMSLDDAYTALIY